MQTRKFDEMISYFNRKVSDMYIDRKYKMELLAMITAIGMAHEKELDAQLEQRWIPCSERLPEKNGRYLVTRGLNAIGALWNRVYIVNYSDLMGIKSTKIFWIGNVGKSDFERIEDVIAWMPLPEPYKEPAP